MSFRVARAPCSAIALSAQVQPAVLDFLAPSFVRSATQSCRFSTARVQGYPREMNKNRGVSPLRRTGLRHPVSVSKDPLPMPVLDATKRSKIETDPDHGLWGFFNADKSLLSTPEEDVAHGRSWTVEELRKKSWEDLHSLWWVCAKDRNRIATSNLERLGSDIGFGDHEANERDETIRKTQRAIKHVLTERWYAWEHARRLSQEDETVDLSGEGPAYEPYKVVADDVEESIEEAASERTEETPAPTTPTSPRTDRRAVL